MNIEDLIYTAGLFDGEGCILIASSKINRTRGSVSPNHWLSVAINMTDENVIKWLHETFGGHFTTFLKVPHQTQYRWRVVSKQAANFLSQVLPYLKTKKEQAIVGIEFQNTKKPRSGRKGKLTPEIIEQNEKFKIQLQKMK